MASTDDKAAPGERHQGRRSRALAAAWALVIAMLLLVPSSGDPVDWLPPWLTLVADDLVHAALFAVQGWLTWPLFDPSARRRSAALVLVGCAAYAGLLETLQISVPGRGFELMDIVAGVLGAGLGVALRGRRVHRSPGSASDEALY